MNYIEFIERLNNKYSGTKKITKKGSIHLCKFNEDEYLHSFFYGIDEKKASELEYLISSIKPSCDHIEKFIDSLKVSNGAVLYAGSVVLFGYPDNQDDYSDRPSSIIEMNKRDKVSCCNESLLYIGNSPCSLGGNINFYYELNECTILGFKDGVKMTSWNSLDDFWSGIYEKFDGAYLDTGINVHFGSKEHFVYNNIQKYIL